MALTSGKTYRFISKAYGTKALNVYGNNAASTGRNVCLYADTPADPMQKWKYSADSGIGNRLHSTVNNNYVLDRSDGSASGSANNNAHLCAVGSTSAADSALTFINVSGDVYRIRLANKPLFLTAVNMDLGPDPVSNITSANLATANGNVYWATGAPSGTVQYNEQCWIAKEVAGGSGGGESGEGQTVTVTGMPDVLYNGAACYPNDTEYFHWESGMFNGTWAVNKGPEKVEKIKNFYEKVYGYAPNTVNCYLYNLFGARYSGSSQHHSGVDMYACENGLTIHSAHAGKVAFKGGTWGAVGIYDSVEDVTYIYLHMEVDKNISIGKDVGINTILGIQSDVGVEGNHHLHFEVRKGKATGPAGLPTITENMTSISPYSYM